MSIAAVAALKAEGIFPDMAAGLSLGEYSALVCSGAFDFVDAVKLIKKRGRFMQEAVPAGVGAMAAIIGLKEEVLERGSGKVSPCRYCRGCKLQLPWTDRYRRGS